MYSERLFLRVSLRSAGWDDVNPPVIVGASGIRQKFTCVARKGNRTVAFEVYDREVEAPQMIASYIKKFDTGIPVFVLSPKGAATEVASTLSKEYGMPILTQEGVAELLALEEAGEQVARVE